MKPVRWQLGSSFLPAAFLFLGAASVLSPSWTSTAIAQDEKKEGVDDAEVAKERELREIHIQILDYLLQQQRYDLAAKSMTQFMEKGKDAKPETYVKVMESSRTALRTFEIIREQVEDIQRRVKAGAKPTDEDERLLSFAGGFPEFMRQYDEQRRKVASNDERIKTLIPWLGKGGGAREEAMGQLDIAGAHAVPHFVDTLLQSQDDQLIQGIYLCIRDRIQGRAVAPLLAGLRGLRDAETNADSRRGATRDLIIKLLGEMGYRQAVPVLKELSQDQKVAKASREAAAAAFTRISTPGQKEKPVHELYYELADEFWQDKVTPRPLPGDTVDAWVWENNRIARKPVAESAYKDAMARRYSWDALRTAPDNEYMDAWALFLQAIHRFEAGNKGKDGAPIADELKLVEKWLDSTYTTVAAGANRILAALKKALDKDLAQTDAHTAMVIKLLQALSVAGGDEAIRKNPESLDVLSRGLTHPNYIVRIETAINTVKMHPNTPAALWTRVVPALSEAAGLAGKDSVLLITTDQKVRDGLTSAFTDAGAVVVSAASLNEAREVANKQSGFTAVIFTHELDTAKGQETLKGLLDHAALTNTPKMWLVAAADLETALGAAAGAKSVFPIDVAKEPAAVIEYYKTTVKAKPLTPEASTAYTLTAIGLLRELAAAESKVFDYNSAEATLIRMLEDPREDVAKAAGTALGLYNSNRAQRALLAAGVKPGVEPVQLAALAGLAESGRKFGNLMTAKTDAAGIVKLTALSQDAGATQPLRTGASAAVGALNITGEKLFDLLLKGSGPAGG